MGVLLYSDARATGAKHKNKSGGNNALRYYLGIDLGSTSCDIALLDRHGHLVYSDYKRTLGRPRQVLKGRLERLFERTARQNINAAAITGSAGRQIAAQFGLPYVNEIAAQGRAICAKYPAAATAIDMGGQDSKLLIFRKLNGSMRLVDFVANSACAAGTGSFLDQQAQRLGVDIENEFAELALASGNAPQMAGRCSVFAKSDMIHLQQQATPVADIVAGLCLALARNLKGNLGRGKELVGPILFTGGVAANRGVVDAIEKVLGLERGEVFVPADHFFTGAIGAVLSVIQDRRTEKQHLAGLDKIMASNPTVFQIAKTQTAEALRQPTLPPPQSRVYQPQTKNGEKVDCFLGVDVGSISTNVVLMSPDKKVLAKAYLMTAGRPLEAIKSGLSEIQSQIKFHPHIIAAATTGSGRHLTGDFLGADVVINEITAQAAGAAIVNPAIDTIFEIGGQDSKYISLKNGVVVDFEMNHACAAGTGSFLEEQAQRLGVNIKDEFAELAFSSDSPIKLGQRCTVFMESDLLSFQQSGAQIKDLLAGLSYSITANYLNRVVGRRKTGEVISFQGGVAFNKAVAAAFEQTLKKPILIPDHHEVTGALGAASIAAEFYSGQTTDYKSKFKGFENIAQAEYDIETFNCEHCSNHCQIRQVKVSAGEPLYYGSRCDRYNIKSNHSVRKGFDAFKWRNEKMFELAGLSRSADTSKAHPETHRVRIGIPLALANLQLLPLFAQFFNRLGVEVIVSKPTKKSTIRTGVESVAAATCFPVKVAYGHIAELLAGDADYIFVPSIITMPVDKKLNRTGVLCPYLQSLPYQIKAVFGEKLNGKKILTTPLYLDGDTTEYRAGFAALAEELGVSKLKAAEAIEAAIAVQDKFEKSCRQKGKEVLNNLGPDEKLLVLVSRPYNGSDAAVNLDIAGKLAALGMNIIPIDFLDLDKANSSDAKLHKNTYWKFGQNILKAADIIAANPKLFAVYLSNFSCGPDSFLTSFFKDILSDKPALIVELDEHSADAGLQTRLEAYLEGIKPYRCPDSGLKKQPIYDAVFDKSQTLYVPWMCVWCGSGVSSSRPAGRSSAYG